MLRNRSDMCAKLYQVFEIRLDHVGSGIDICDEIFIWCLNVSLEQKLFKRRGM